MKNNNYPTWLVPLEIAKELKAIGFNEPCLIENVETHSEDYNLINFEEDMCSDITVMLEDVIFVENKKLEDELGIYKHFVLRTAIPTWEQVFEWFREKGLECFIEIEYQSTFEECCYYCYVITNPRGKTINCKSDFNDYNEAREALVKALIRTYKNEQL